MSCASAEATLLESVLPGLQRELGWEPGQSYSVETQGTRRAKTVLEISTVFEKKSNPLLSVRLAADPKGDKAALHCTRRDLIGNYEQHLGQLFPLGL